MGITGTTGVMVGTTPDLPLLERLSVYWERPQRVLRPATPMVTISPMAMGAGSAARPRREFAIAHVPCGSRPSVSRNGFWQVMPSCAKSRPTDTRLKMIWNLSLIYAARNQTVGALRNPKRRATFFKDMLSLRRGRPTPKSPPAFPSGLAGRVEPFARDRPRGIPNARLPSATRWPPFEGSYGARRMYQCPGLTRMAWKCQPPFGRESRKRSVSYAAQNPQSRGKAQQS